MKRLTLSLRSILSVTVLVALILAVAWWAGRAGQGTSTSAALSPLAEPISPLATPTPWVEPTYPPSPTIPPVPTPLPTPVVTPIPLASPPFIPELADRPTEPYRIVFRKENTLWIMYNDGSELKMILDSKSRASLYLSHSPYIELPIEWASPSPEGRRLALVLSDVWQIEDQGQTAHFFIYVLDTETGELDFLVEGISPEWSSDANHIAFVKEDGLWVVDTATREERKVATAEEGFMVREVAWSPDNENLGFSYRVASLAGDAEKRVVSVNEPDAQPLIVLPVTWGMLGTAWLANGQSILYVAPELEPTGQIFDNLWIVDVATQATKRLTTLANVSYFDVSRSREDWIVFSGKYVYEVGGNQPSDLWLLDASRGELVRLSKNAPSGTAHEPHWSPDGTQIVYQRPEQGIWTLDLRDGSERQIYPGEPGVFYYDLAVLPGV